MCAASIWGQFPVVHSWLLQILTSIHTFSKPFLHMIFEHCTKAGLRETIARPGKTQNVGECPAISYGRTPKHCCCVEQNLCVGANVKSLLLFPPMQYRRASEEKQDLKKIWAKMLWWIKHLTWTSGDLSLKPHSAIKLRDNCEPVTISWPHLRIRIEDIVK